jgi:tetratricopeptide (TPR) repeat protein
MVRENKDSPVIRIIKAAGTLLALTALFIATAASEYPLGRLSDPAGQLDALLESCKENPTPEQMTTLAWLLHIYRGDDQQARSFFEKALTLQPENPWARYGLCIVNEIEGRFDELLSQSLFLCENSPSHPSALLSLLNVRGLFGAIPAYNERVKRVLQPILAERRSGCVQFEEICREILSAVCQSEGEADGFNDLMRGGGYPVEWRVVGPFGEYPNLAFLSTWQPESDRALKSRYKDSTRVLRRREYSSPNGFFQPYWARHGVYYAETLVRAPAQGEVILRVSSPFPVAVFLNRRCVYSKDAVRSYTPLVEYVAASLSPGDNRFLMKCLVGGWALRGDACFKNLRQRCQTSAQNLAPSIQILSPPPGSPPLLAEAATHAGQSPHQPIHSPWQSPSLAYFSNVLEANPADPLALACCGMLKGAEGDVQQAKRFLLASEKSAPSWAYLKYVLGAALASDASLPDQVRRSEAKARFQAALDGALVFPLSLYELALLDLAEQKESEAIDKLNQCIAQSPRFFPFHERLYRLYQQKEWGPEQRKQLEAMLALELESCEPYHIAADFYRSTNQHEKLEEVIERVHRGHIHSEYQAGHLREIGQDARALSEYAKLKALQPQQQTVRKALVELYEQSGRWVDAERELKEAIRIFPDDLSFWKMLAELKGYTGKESSERQIWRRVLAGNFVDKDARKALRAHGEKDLLDEYEIPSLPIAQDPGVRDKYAGISSAILIDQTVEEIFPDGSARRKTHQLILLNDKKAIDAWGELDVRGEDLLELRTIKKDGSILEPEPPGESKSTFSMAGLQNGDFIEYKYITSAAPRPDRPPRYVGDRFFFQNIETPMQLSQYVVIVPSDMRLTYEERNNPPPLSVIPKKDKKVYRWEARDVPAVPREPNVASENEFLPFVRVAANFDEDSEFLRYQDHNISVTKISDEVREITARVLADCPNDSDSRARAVYAFVNREIRGEGGGAYLSKSPSETLADRRGDRLALARAMLEVAGVPTRMLVVRGKLEHASKVFPESFNSGLLALQDETGQYIRFLDFSSRYVPYGYIRATLQNGTAVPLQDFAAADFGVGEAHSINFLREQLTIPGFSRDDNCEKRTLQATIGGDGSVEGTQVHQYAGDRAAVLRTGLLEAEEYQIKEFIARMANASFRAASVASHKTNNLSDAEKPLSVEYAFKAPAFGRISGNEMVLDQLVPASRLGAVLASLETRATPLQIDADFNLSFEGELKLPPGARVVALPSATDLETAFGHYHLRFTEGENAVHIVFDMYLKAQKVLPADYPKLAEFCRGIDTAERAEVRVRLEP